MCERPLGDKKTTRERLLGERRLGERSLNDKKYFCQKVRRPLCKRLLGDKMLFTKDNWEKDAHAKDYLATKEDIGLAVGLSLLSFIQAKLNVMSYHIMSSRVYAEIRVLAF